MASTSQIRINKKALRKNLEFIRELLGKTKLSVVIKGNAYGHGIRTFLPLAEELGADHFSVYSSSEAMVANEVKQPDTTIMVMGYIMEEDMEIIIQDNIEFYISDTNTLQLAIRWAKKLQKKAVVHIDVETGMNRTGLSVIDFEKIIPTLKENCELLFIKGLTSHFAGAESIANYTRVIAQFEVFNERAEYLEQHGIVPELKHIGSSAAMINYPRTKLDMIRSGIMVYGFWPTKETYIKHIHSKIDKTNPLERIISWNSKVVITKVVPQGEFIGYGLSYQAQDDMLIMVVPVGYSNGYSRSLSNNGAVLVHGQYARVIGTVNMNMLICNITHIPTIEVGDKVILIGSQGDNEITFASFSEMNDSLNYEILARLPENIEREVF